MTHFNSSPESYCTPSALTLRLRLDPAGSAAAQAGPQPSALFVSRRLGKEGFHDIENLVLLSMGQPLNLLEGLTDATLRKDRFCRPRLPKNLVNRQTKDLSNSNYNIGPRQCAGALPIAYTRGPLPNLPRQFTQGNPCLLSQGAKIVFYGFGHGSNEGNEDSLENLPRFKVQCLQSPKATRKDRPCNVHITAQICAVRTHAFCE